MNPNNAETLQKVNYISHEISSCPGGPGQVLGLIFQLKLDELDKWSLLTFLVLKQSFRITVPMLSNTDHAKYHQNYQKLYGRQEQIIFSFY